MKHPAQQQTRQAKFVTGMGPSYDEIQQLLTGLYRKGKNLSWVKHRFHFYVDGNTALVLWISTGRLYQKQMSRVAAEVLINDLEQLGFKAQALN